MRILFAGTSALGEETLRAIAQHHDLVGLLTQPDRPAGRHQKPRSPELKSIFRAIAPNKPIFQPEVLKEESTLNSLKALEPDLLVTMAYGKIVPKELLTLPRLTSLNIHASLLPRHRGASPIQAAILAADIETGITIMYMDEGLDTGDLLLAKKIRLHPRETMFTLSQRLSKLAPEALLEALSLLESGDAPRLKQDETIATTTYRLKHADTILDWSRPAIELERKIRALYPKPGACGEVLLAGGRSMMIKIFSAQLRFPSSQLKIPPGSFFLSTTKECLLACSLGALLLEEVQPQSRSSMTFRDFQRGYPLCSEQAF